MTETYGCQSLGHLLSGPVQTKFADRWPQDWVGVGRVKQSKEEGSQFLFVSLYNCSNINIC